MTITRHEVIEDKFGVRPKNPNTVVAETTVHDYGHVALISTYGSDDAIADAAQVSYGRSIGDAIADKRTSYETRRLLRYMMRHRHTSPFEHAEVSFYLRVPIFVMRQLIRHRTANVNEYSARYSELRSEFYVPSPEYIQRQSTTNKQGRSGEVLDDSDEIQMEFMAAQEEGHRAYKRMLERGVSRELARVPTSVGTYTECYWKCDLHNLMHLFKLRCDSHAQQEIQDYANAMYECVRPFFPQSFLAWENYVRDAYILSVAEQKMLANLLESALKAGVSMPSQPLEMSDREYRDFKFFLDTLLIK